MEDLLFDFQRSFAPPLPLPRPELSIKTFKSDVKSFFGRFSNTLNGKIINELNYRGLCSLNFF